MMDDKNPNAYAGTGLKNLRVWKKEKMKWAG